MFVTAAVTLALVLGWLAWAFQDPYERLSKKAPFLSGSAAENAFRAIVEAAPADHRSWDGLARSLAQQARFSEAVAAHDRAIALFPYHADYRTNKIGTLLAASLYDESLKEIDFLAARDYWRSDRPNELISLAYALHTRRDTSEEFLHFLTRYPHAHTGYAKELKGDAEYRSGRFSMALESYVEASRLGSATAGLMHKISDAKLKLEDKQ